MLTAAICAPDVEPKLARGLAHAEVAGHHVPCALFDDDTVGFEPASPAHRRHVLVRKRAFACSFRDKSIVIGVRKLLDHQAYAPFGSEFVADVLAVGDDVQHLSPGERVLSNGSYAPGLPNGAPPGLVTNLASQATQVVHADKLTRVPTSVDDVAAAGLSTCAQTAFAMVRRLGVVAGERVLVTAATSGTSVFLVQRLARLGAHVTALTSSRSNRGALLALGAHDVVTVDLTRDSWDVAGLLRVLVRDDGPFDAVVDPYCDLYLPRVLPYLRFGARYATCGYVDQIPDLRGAAQRYGEEAVHAVIVAVITGNLTLMGNCLGETRDLEDALRAHALGELQVPVGAVFGGDEVAPFVERSFGPARGLGKVVFRYT